jgi:hypothetical protein
LLILAWLLLVVVVEPFEVTAEAAAEAELEAVTEDFLLLFWEVVDLLFLCEIDEGEEFFCCCCCCTTGWFKADNVGSPDVPGVSELLVVTLGIIFDVRSQFRLVKSPLSADSSAASILSSQNRVGCTVKKNNCF